MSDNFNSEYEKLLNDRNDMFMTADIYNDTYTKTFKKPLPPHLEWPFDCLTNYPVPIKKEFFIDDFEPAGQMILDQLIAADYIFIDDNYIYLKYEKSRASK